MTADKLITARVGTTLDEARDILQRYRIEKLPLTDEAGCLKGLITVKDISKKADYPNAALDKLGRLLVGAAVGVGADLEKEFSFSPRGMSMPWSSIPRMVIPAE